MTEILSLLWAAPGEPALRADGRGVPILTDVQEWPLETD